MTQINHLVIGGDTIEYRYAGDRGSRRPQLVMLHEGLGSVSMWKDFPEQLAQATGCRVVTYSRLGYGGSSPLTQDRDVAYMHDEARQWLPAILDRLGVNDPVLIGHSDGASIALIFAAEPDARLSGIVALAPHVKVEPVTIASIADAKTSYESAALRGRLAVHHRDVDGTFWGWNRIWLDPAFRDWNIESLLPAIRAPVLAIQGLDDEYGTLDQIESIRRVLPGTQILTLPNCRHSPHRDQPAAVLEATRKFIDRIDDARRAPTTGVS